MKNKLFESLANVSKFMNEIGEQSWARVLLNLAESVESGNIECEKLRKK